MNEHKTYTLKRWHVLATVAGFLLTVATLVIFLINDRYVVINRADLNTKNIADLTLVVDKLITKTETHIQLIGHPIMEEKMSDVKKDFDEMKKDIKEILRRIPK